MSSLGFQDMFSKLQHILRNAHIRNVTEIRFDIPYFVVITQRCPQQAFVKRLQRDDVLSVRYDDATERDAILVVHGLPDHREGFGADLSGWCNVIGPVEVTLVDFVPWYKTVDVDRVRTFDLDSLQLVFVDFDIPTLANLVAQPLVLSIDDLAGFLIDHLLPQLMAGLGVDLVEASFLGLRHRREQLNRARDQRKLQITLPVGARSHLDPIDVLVTYSATLHVTVFQAKPRSR